MNKQIIFWTKLGNQKRWKRQKFANFYGKDGTHPTLTKAWLEYRLRLWRHTALPSILNQTETDFQYWVLSDPRNDERFNNIIPFNTLDPRIKIIRSTQDWCDETTDQIGPLIDQTVDKWYLIRLDSDDVYHPLMLEELLEADKSRKDIVYYIINCGYAFDIRKKKLKSHDANNAYFGAHIYNRGVPITLKAEGGFKETTDCFPTTPWFEPPLTWMKNYSHKFLPNRRFIRVIHDKNNRSEFSGLPGGGVLKNEKRDKIIQDFNARYLIDF